jgi:radical SAM superfamily enzyme YgiQ (UPF0313 family)
LNRSRYSLYLISPRQRYINYPAQSELAKIFGRKRLMIPLALPTVAALTPNHYDIRIIDEEIEPLPTSLPDIVGITTLAATSARALELGQYYRERGVRVVFGGPYASFARDACLPYCDSIIVGEAEGKWAECLADFEREEMKRVYDSDLFTPYKTQSPPRWDLVNMKAIFQAGIQVSRGCPFNCDFCLVSKIFGRKMRYREINNVVEEIRSTPSKYFFFVDDNLTINKKYAKELMRALIPLKISWACMASIDVAQDEELLQLMAEAGCFNILIGFESLNPASLDESNKGHNKSATIYEPAIARIHAAGIHINASFVVGFDHDTLEEFDNIFDFALKNSLPHVNLHLLAAPPGSEVHSRLKQEGRLADCLPELGVGHFPTLHYLNMSQTDLFEKYMETVERLYSYRVVLEKGERLFSGGAFVRKGGDISALLKIRLSWIILKEFGLSSDPDQRALFRLVVRLIRQKKLAIDKGFGYLISMLGNHRHIESHKQRMKEYREMIRKQDQGPWNRRISESGGIPAE